VLCLQPHPVLVRLYREAASEQLKFDSSLLPMTCPPLPWTSVNSGGYLLSSVKMIRLPDAISTHHKARLAETPTQQLYPSFDSLNQLSECPWILNKSVLDVVIEVFNNNGSDELDIPRNISSCPPPPHIHQGMTKAEKAAAFKERAMLRKQKAEMYSLWCDTLYKLSIANHFKDSVFWFPHNMDFRGRVYPCPPHFHHLGGDMVRSLLLFAKGEPLGKEGLDWLKIHLVNLTGLKKRDSVAERLTYADELLPDILDSADKPLTGSGWWKQSEEPWQTLACCMEIARAVRSPDPLKYVSHFPVHQDGSCNGLQHYAALGRDKHGAIQVNLHPCDRPQDVYSGVATLVEKQRQQDAADGVKIAQTLEGFIKRKVIKQTVMTTVYGVTRYGAKLQVLKQLKDIPDFPKDATFPASFYIVQKTFSSLQEMFTATREIQDWFTECAKLVSQVCGQPMEWVTPLGFPIVQPYHKPTNNPMNSSRAMKINSRADLYLRPNVMKQKNAFPPNFIHSLDSSHMMLTSLFCQRSGITFVSVHDCYWTHPSTVHIMNKICREQFVALHNQPILEDLSKFLVEKFGYKSNEFKGDGSAQDQMKIKLNKLLPKYPPKGDFKLENVLDSTYFFS